MLSSSSEYIQALREGKYLQFLGWTDFITQKYALKDADDTVNFLIFEWLNNVYLEVDAKKLNSSDRLEEEDKKLTLLQEDAKKLAVLQAVCDLEYRPLQGKLEYSLKIISSALFICMVFQKSDIYVTLSPEEKVMKDTVNPLIEKCLRELNQFIYQERLEGMQTQFYQWVEHVDAKDVIDVFQKVDAITKPRYLLEDYILHLERIKLKDDELYATRLSMARRFLGYLYEQTELAAEVKEVIATYVNSLRELHPGKGEVDRLDEISPPSTLAHTWRWVTGIGVSFFSIVLHEKTIGELITGTAMTFNSIDTVNSEFKK
ncbi:TPA: helical bundle domain-containing protein [Legionella anisa]